MTPSAPQFTYSLPIGGGTFSMNMYRPWLDETDPDEGMFASVHGYGRKRRWHSLLLGGRNRDLADHVARHLRRRLPDYDIIDDVGALPKPLAGMHPKNPVNLPPSAGVQIELPATVRWNRKGRHWSDHGSHGRAPQVQALIDALTDAARSWP